MEIKTKFLGATDTLGSRFKSYMVIKGKVKTLTLPRNYNVSANEMHRICAENLAEKHKLVGQIYLVGDSPKGYIFKVSL